MLFSLLTGALFIKDERTLLRSVLTITAIIMAILGATAVILFQEDGVGFALNSGILMNTLAAIFWSFLGLTNRMWLANKLPPIMIVTVIFNYVSILLTHYAFIDNRPVTGTANAFKWIVLSGSSLLSLTGGQRLYYYLLPRFGLFITTSVQLLGLYVTGLLSLFIFSERITAFQFIGHIILLIGCWIIIRNKAKLQVG